MGKWTKFYTDHEDAKTLNKGLVDVLKSVITSAPDKERKIMVQELIQHTTDALYEKGSPPHLTDDTFGPYMAGLAYFLHSELKTLPEDRLSGIKKMVVGKEQWQTNIRGDLQPNSAWKISNADIKDALKEATLSFLEHRGLGHHREQSDSISSSSSPSPSPVPQEGVDSSDADSPTHKMR